METVKIEKKKLLTKLIANRNAHRALFLKAQVGYRKTIIRHLDRMLKQARAGKEVQTQIIVRVPAPQDMTSSYDRVISMMQWTQDELIELTEEEFSQYIRDNWRWSADNFRSSSFYSKSK